MVSLRLAAALTAVGLFTSGMVFAEGAKPNDAQIAHIAYTAGQLDIEAAEQAKQKSKNKDVLAFAADMERDHKAVNEKALALVKKLGVTPEDNDTALTSRARARDYASDPPRQFCDRMSLSDNIIQKGLAFGRHWSGTVR
jgi:predicted outer membrane protein